jgi:hypothetical protein
MDAVDEETGPVYQATKANRVVASVVLAAAAAAVVWVIASGGSPIKVLALSGGAAIIGFLALAALRFQVRADPDYLVVCGGGRLRRIPWAQIKSFGVGGPKGNDVFIVLADKRKQRLPLVQVTSGQTSPTEARDALQRYWRTQLTRRHRKQSR